MYTRIYCLSSIGTNEFDFNADFVYWFGSEGKIASVDMDIMSLTETINESFAESINRLSGCKETLAECMADGGVYIHKSADLWLANATMNNIKAYLKDLTMADFKSHGRRRLHEITHPTEPFVCFRDDDGEPTIMPLYDFIFNSRYKEFAEVLNLSRVFYVKY